MSKVFSAKNAEALIKRGGTAADVPAGAVLTPSARDILKAASGSVVGKKSATATAPVAVDEPYVPDFEYRWDPGSDPKTPEAIQAFFHSPAIETLKERMCDIGRRMWEREFTDGNGGNLTIRVGDNMVLCTPTLISKGFMKPDEMCLVDLNGKQLAGKRKRTSEVLTHIAVMKAQPKAKACCHAHPVHATAFAVAKVQPPTCMIPEAEVFLGQIGIAEYQTPGTPANAKVVGDAAREHHSVLMANHGVITWGDHIEDAYWKMENTDSYCRTIWVASFLGKDLSTITGGQARELIELRKSLGMSDKRESWKECELCDNADWRPGVVCNVPTRDAGSAPAQPAATPSDPQAEVLVKQITDMVIAEMAKG